MPQRSEPPPGLTLRDSTRLPDRNAIRKIVTETGFFRPDEIEVAVELVDARLEKGDSSGYHFLFAERAGTVVGYACFGPIACTIGSFDLYWIAVAPSCQEQGVGRWLLADVERRVQAMGGRLIYIETSGRPQYAPTRAFYEHCGYDIAATLVDFYDQGDDKVIWEKKPPRGLGASRTTD